VHPNYEQDRLNSVIKMVKGHIADIGGHVLAVDDWGKRRLAYPIEKQKSGNYVLIYFDAEPSAVVELQTWFELQAQILAQLIVRLDEKPAGVPSHHEDNDEVKDEITDDGSDEDYDEEEEIEVEDDSEETSEEAVKETV